MYAFCQANYDAVVPLWRAVHDELTHFLGLVALLAAEWCLPWNPVVLASDAALQGWAVGSSWWSVDDVRRVGRVSERTRFRTEDMVGAREHSLTAAGFVLDSTTRKWKLRSDSDECVYDTDDFPEVPSHLLASAKWKSLVQRPWIVPGDGIVDLELRAVLNGLRRFACSVFGAECRQLLLCDNMGVVLILTRFGSEEFRLLTLVRKFVAYCLSKGIVTSVRWIPS